MEVGSTAILTVHARDSLNTLLALHPGKPRPRIFGWIRGISSRKVHIGANIGVRHRGNLRGAGRVGNGTVFHVEI